MNTVPKLYVAANNQDTLGQKLMDSIRVEIMKPDYDHLTISNLIGILEMLKIEMYERTK